ncbi:MAG: ABC transporter permease subunit [Deltaproteobacteria bacterium]|nr:ABC transporter permease subunit [Deltaproteobacteria bacterium]
MLRFILGRLVGAVFVLWIIITITFFLMRFAPGGPFDQERELPPNVKANRWLLYNMGVEVATPEPAVVTDVAKLETGEEYPEGTYLATATAAGDLKLGLMTLRDVPPRTYRFTLPNDGTLEALPVTADTELPAFGRIAVVPKTSWQQYLDSVGDYMQLDFGVTFTSEGERTVKEELGRAFPISMQLGLISLALAILIGVTIGLVAGLKQNTWIDYTAMSGAMVGISVPSMVLGPILIAIFVLGLGWLPYGGWDPSPGSEWAAWQIRLLPIITLALTYAAPFARITRGGMLEVIRSDYIRTARAKGLGEGRVVTRHALKGALLPTVSYLGPATARILTGSVVVERVFGIAGLSEFFVTPALNRDYPMVLGVVVVYSGLLILLNLAVDIAYTFLDPRVKLR